MQKKLIIFIPLLFVFTVNLLFIYFAQNTFSGDITNDAYRKGLDYNQVIDAQLAQHGELKAVLNLVIDENGDYIITFDSSKTCDSIDFKFFSTTDSKKDFSKHFSIPQKKYELKLENDVKGPWLIRIKCYIGESEYYFSKKFDFY